MTEITETKKYSVLYDVRFVVIVLAVVLWTITLVCLLRSLGVEAQDQFGAPIDELICPTVVHQKIKPDPGVMASLGNRIDVKSLEVN